jgi:plastocyanin
MNHYQISGIVILILVVLMGAFTFWPVNQVPTVEVAFPDTPEEATKDEVKAPTATKPAPAPAPAPAAGAGAGARTYEKGVYVTTVLMTDKGFEPRIVEANNGEEIRFVNKTGRAMHIVAEEKTSSVYYRSINQSNTVFKNGTYQLQLPELGIFNYKNLNGPETGQIIIK